MCDRRDLTEVRRDLSAWLAKWGGKYPKLTGWVEEDIEETLKAYKIEQHTGAPQRGYQAAHLRCAILPNGESCSRHIRALTIERHEAWLEDHRYLNMELLKEHKEEALRQPT